MPNDPDGYEVKTAPKQEPRCTICGDLEGDLHNVLTNGSVMPKRSHKFTTEGDRQAFKVIYSQMFERSTEVTVTAEQYAALHGSDTKERELAEQFVTDTALIQIDSEPMERVMAIATDEDDEELFDRG